VKRRGKSSPPCQQWQGPDKPHPEQDQIREEKLLASIFAFSGELLSGRSLEPRSNPRPREMAASSASGGTDRIRLTDLHLIPALRIAEGGN